MNKLSNKKRTQVDDIDRGVYDIKNEFKYRSKTEKGLTEDIVKQISLEKDEPEWMLEKRLEALEIFNSKDDPVWGPDLSTVNIDEITTYIRPDADMTSDWEEIPQDIYDTFDALGIPEAEKEARLSGVGAQYDSEVVYHSIQDVLLKQGVIYTDFESGLRDYEDKVKEYFGKAITPDLHKYAALHYAVWSGGSFVFVPKGVDVTTPLQSYFRMNAPGAGQFEHTLIIIEDDAYCHFIEGCSAPKYNALSIHAGAVELFVGENSTLRYSTIENWSRNMYNLNTKRAVVEKDAKIEWISGSFGSEVSMLYPTSVLVGENATSEYTGISFAGKGQYIDTGAQSIHLAPNTSAVVSSKSISKGGGTGVYRGMVYMGENSQGSKASVDCESLMLDDISRADTIPLVDVKNQNVDVGHEAKIGKISDEVIFYLMSRGISEAEARAMVVRGFAEPVSKELPLEYAVEMNQLINLELEGTIG